MDEYESWSRNQLIAYIIELKEANVALDNKAYDYRNRILDKQEEVDAWKARYWHSEEAGLTLGCIGLKFVKNIVYSRRRLYTFFISLLRSGHRPRFWRRWWP